MFSNQFDFEIVIKLEKGRNFTSRNEITQLQSDEEEEQRALSKTQINGSER